MWGQDYYPYIDGAWPEPSVFIAKQFDEVPLADVRKITCDNAANFYGLAI